VTTLATPAIVLILVAGSPSAADGTGSVPTVQNPGQPAGGEREVVLEQLWQLGTDADDPLLGTIERVLLLDDGRLLLLDTQLSQVLECSPDGQVIRTLGRAGQGPGELTGPRDLVRFADGGIGLVAAFPGRLVCLHEDGTPGATITPVYDRAEGNFTTLHRALAAGEDLILGGSVMTMNPDQPVQTRTFFLGRFDRSGTLIAEMVTGHAEFDMRHGRLHESWLDFVWSRMDVAADGSAVVGIPRDRFELTWFDPQGRPRLRATLPTRSWQRNRKAHDRIHSIVQDQADHMPGTRAVVEPTAPVIVDLSIRDDGTVWCLTAASMWSTDDEAFATYDVLDRDGRYRERVRVVCDGDATRDRLMFAGGRFYRIAGYWDAIHDVRDEQPDPDAEPMSVTCYRPLGV
jgi:hypothetical protein